MDTEKAEHVMSLARKVYPVLAGQESDIQGAVLCDILARYLAGYTPPEVRQSILDDMLDTVWKMVDVYHEEFHGEDNTGMGRQN